MKEIIIATNNQGKVKEFKNILSEMEIQLLSLKDIHMNIEVVEDGNTFKENAVKKAEEISKLTCKITIADDSGLCVDQLGGRPGVYSARYAGENASDADRIEKLLMELHNEQNRKAKFVCCIALAIPEQDTVTFTGECSGKIALEPSGANGFGYDPVFIPDGLEQSFAQLDSEAKNKISHRAKALKKLRDYMM